MNAREAKRADLSRCRDCSTAVANSTGRQECPVCGGGLEHLGEIEYLPTDRGEGGTK